MVCPDQRLQSTRRRLENNAIIHDRDRIRNEGRANEG